MLLQNTFSIVCNQQRIVDFLSFFVCVHIFVIGICGSGNGVLVVCVNI